MQKTIQGLLGALPLDPDAKFYLASVADKAGHKITDALGMSKGRGTFTEGLLSDRGKKELDAVAKYVLSQGQSNIDYIDYAKAGMQSEVFNSPMDLYPLRFEKALGKAKIIGEDANNVYIRDTYDFSPGYGTVENRGGMSVILNDLLKYISEDKVNELDSRQLKNAKNRGRASFSLGAATLLAPLLSYPDIDTRAPRVDLKIPKQTPGVFYAPSTGLEKAVPKPKPKIAPKADKNTFYRMLRGPVGDQ